MRRPLQEVLGPGPLLASRLLRRDLCTISLRFWSRRGLILSGIVSRVNGAFLLLQLNNEQTVISSEEKSTDGREICVGPLQIRLLLQIGVGLCQRRVRKRKLRCRMMMLLLLLLLRLLRLRHERRRRCVAAGCERRRSR